MLRRLLWLGLALAAAALAVGCFTGDDDDDDSGGIVVNCNPTACEAIADATDCDAYANSPNMAAACQYCLTGTIHDAQIAECILDNRDIASGDSLVNGCIQFVDEQCTLKKDH